MGYNTLSPWINDVGINIPSFLLPGIHLQRRAVDRARGQGGVVQEGNRLIVNMV